MNKKKITAIAVVVAAIAIAIVGATLAFFTDTAGELKNTFTVGDVEIKLDEYNVVTTSETESGTVKYVTKSDGSRTEDGNTYPDIYPGAKLPKDPTVWNTASNSVYVRMDVTITSYNIFKDIFVRHNITEPAAQKAAMAEIFPDYNPLWQRFDEVDGGTTMTYKYLWTHDGKNDNCAALAKGEKTAPIFETIVVPTWFTSKDMEDLKDGFKVTAFAYAIQADGENNRVAQILELKGMNASN